MVRVGSFRRRRALGRASGRGNRQARKRTHALARSVHGRRTRELCVDFAPSPSPSSPRGDVFTHHVWVRRRRRRRTNDATTRRERYNSDEGSEQSTGRRKRGWWETTSTRRELGRHGKRERREPKSEHDERDDEFVGKEEKERYERWRRGLVREGEEERERDGY